MTIATNNYGHPRTPPHSLAQLDGESSLVRSPAMMPEGQGNGAGRGGSIIVGVTDKAADANRISKMDSVSPRKVGSRQVVGVKREADLLGETTEQYFARWKNAIKNSDLSSPLKEDVA